jgi:hypothetical protein
VVGLPTWSWDGFIVRFWWDFIFQCHEIGDLGFGWCGEKECELWSPHPSEWKWEQTWVGKFSRQFGLRLRTHTFLVMRSFIAVSSTQSGRPRPAEWCEIPLNYNRSQKDPPDLPRSRCLVNLWLPKALKCSQRLKANIPREMPRRRTDLLQRKETDWVVKALPLLVTAQDNNIKHHSFQWIRSAVKQQAQLGHGS